MPIENRLKLCKHLLMPLILTPLIWHIPGANKLYMWKAGIRVDDSFTNSSNFLY
jgi:hypothetical protein